MAIVAPLKVITETASGWAAPEVLSFWWLHCHRDPSVAAFSHQAEAVDVCTCAHVHMYMTVCVHMQLCVLVYFSVQVFFMFVHVCTCVHALCVHTCAMHMCVYLCACICIFIHVYLCVCSCSCECVHMTVLHIFSVFVHVYVPGFVHANVYWYVSAEKGVCRWAKHIEGQGKKSKLLEDKGCSLFAKVPQMQALGESSANGWEVAKWVDAGV